jgi:hypothetical protein
METVRKFTCPSPVDALAVIVAPSCYVLVRCLNPALAGGLSCHRSTGTQSPIVGANHPGLAFAAYYSGSGGLFPILRVPTRISGTVPVESKIGIFETPIPPTPLSTPSHRRSQVIWVTFDELSKCDHLILRHE